MTTWKEQNLLLYNTYYIKCVRKLQFFFLNIPPFAVLLFRTVFCLRPNRQ